MNDNTDPTANADNLQRALAGQYHVDIKSLFSSSLALYKRHLGLLLRATGVLMAIGLASFTVLYSVLELDATSVDSMQSSSAGLLDILMLVIMSPLIVGFRMLGIKLAAQQSPRVGEVFQYFPLLLILVTANLLISLLIQVGLNLLILPGFYVYMVTQFAVVLIANKRAGLVQSIVLSVKVTNKYLFPFSLLLLVFLLMFLLVLFTMGLAILWVGPMYSLMMGRLYIDLFGFDEAPKTHPTTKDSILDA